MGNLLYWCSFAAAAGFIVACTDSTNDGSSSAAGNGGSGGSGSGTADEGGTPAEGGTVTEAGMATQNPGADASAAGTADAGGGAADGGAEGSAGADGGVACPVSWTGAATGGANCSNTDVCHRNFFSLHVYEPTAPAPIKSVQLIYMAENELAVGTFVATGLEIVDTTIQTNDPGVTYGPQVRLRHASAERGHFDDPEDHQHPVQHRPQ